MKHWRFVSVFRFYPRDDQGNLSKNHPLRDVALLKYGDNDFESSQNRCIWLLTKKSDRNCCDKNGIREFEREVQTLALFSRLHSSTVYPESQKHSNSYTRDAWGGRGFDDIWPSDKHLYVLAP